MRRRAGLVCAIGILIVTGGARSNDEKPGGQYTVDGQSLVLNGQGVRSVIFFDVYHCALYLPRRRMPFNEIISPETPVAIRLRITYDDIPDAMPDAWRAALRSELTDRTFLRVRRVYRDLEEGDLLTITYAKGSGTRIVVNGEHLLTDRGHGLAAEFLEMWLGSDPVSEPLRLDLLAEIDDNG